MDYTKIHSMSNVSNKYHGLPIDVKFHVKQPGKNKFSHEMRIKVFRKRDLDNTYSIDLRNDPDLIQIRHEPDNAFLTAKQKKMILDHLRKYRKAYIEMWNDPSMDNDDLVEKMKEIDSKNKN